MGRGGGIYNNAMSLCDVFHPTLGNANEDDDEGIGSVLRSQTRARWGRLIGDIGTYRTPPIRWEVKQRLLLCRRRSSPRDDATSRPNMSFSPDGGTIHPFRRL